MKTWSVVLALLVCASNAWAVKRSDLVGTWHIERPNAAKSMVAVTITFNENGSFQGFVDKDGKRAWNYEGKWVLSGGWLNYRYTKSDLARLGPGTTDRDKVLEITDKTLRLKNSSGEEIYVRQVTP